MGGAPFPATIHVTLSRPVPVPIPVSLSLTRPVSVSVPAAATLPEQPAVKHKANSPVLACSRLRCNKNAAGHVIVLLTPARPVRSWQTQADMTVRAHQPAARRTEFCRACNANDRQPYRHDTTKLPACSEATTSHLAGCRCWLRSAERTCWGLRICDLALSHAPWGAQVPCQHSCSQPH